MRPLYFALACLFFVAGLIGVILPIIPTTPFMLLALWGFSRSSPRFHHWLYTHKILGPPLQLWNEYRVIPPIAKYFSVFFMAVSLVYLYVFAGIPVWIILVVSIIMATACWFILTRPSAPPSDSK